MTFEEANELVDSKKIYMLGNFRLKRYESICCTCDRRNECNAVGMIYGAVKECNFYKADSEANTKEGREE